MSSISEPPTLYVCRRLPEPSTTATVHYNTDTLAESDNGSSASLNTLSLLIESKWSMFSLTACPGRVAHIPWQSVGSGKTFAASAVALGEGAAVVLKRPRLDIEDAVSPSADEIDLHRASLAQSIMQEVRVLTHMPLRVHDNIITLFGIGWESDPFDENLLWPVMTMEYAGYGNLADFVASKPVALPVKFALLTNVAQGLDALHACGITHGDVKCLNVLVFRSDTDGIEHVAKLSDFGFSIIDDDRGNDEADTKGFLRGGTWPWNAPEWRHSIPMSSLSKSDIYSYGLLAMQVWEDGGDPFQQLQDIKHLHTSGRFDEIERLKSTNALLDALRLRLQHLLEGNEPTFAAAAKILESSVQFDSHRRDLDVILTLLNSVSSGIVGGDVAPELPFARLRDAGGVPNFSELFRRRSEDIPYEAQQQVVKGLVEVYHNPGLDAQLRGLAALEVGFSHITCYGQQVQDLKEALRWITSASVWDKADSLVSRYTHAFSFTAEALGADEAQAMGLQAFQGSSVALDELKRRDKRMYRVVLELVRRYCDYPGVQEFTEETLSLYDFEDVAKLEQQVGTSSVPAQDIVLPSGASILHFAASYGSVGAVKYLIDRGCDINRCNQEGQTPLLYACRSGHDKVALLLLQNGADASMGDKWTGETSVHRLIGFDDDQMETVYQAMSPDQVQAVLSINADERAYGNEIAIAYGDGPPLLWAVAHNKPGLVRLLMTAGADPIQQSELTNDTALGKAIEMHRTSCIAAILYGMKENKGLAPMLAGPFGRAIRNPLSRRMFIHGADYVVTMQKTIDLLLKFGANLEGLTADNIKMTALHMAVRYSSPDVVTHILDVGGAAHINTRCDAFGYTPLHEAIRRGRTDIFHLLLERGADPLIKWDYADRLWSVTFVCTKSMRGDESVHMANHLLSTAGPQLLSDLLDGHSPLKMAIQFQQYKLADCFQKWGADINSEFTVDDLTCTLLGHIVKVQSSRTHYQSVLKFLLSNAGIDKIAPSFLVCEETKESVFDFELKKNAILDTNTAQERLRVLLSHFNSKSHLEHTNKIGLTALHLATLLGHLYAVEMLVDSGSDLDFFVRNGRSGYYGMTALDLAWLSSERSPYTDTSDEFLSWHSRRMQQVIDYLVRKGAHRRIDLLSSLEQKKYVPEGFDDKATISIVLDHEAGQEQHIELSDSETGKQETSTKLTLPRRSKSLVIHDSREVSLRQVVINWFSPSTADELQAFFVEQSSTQKPAGIFSSAPVISWMGDPSGILWCTGPHGSGKSTASALIIEHIRKTHGADTGIAFAFLERNHAYLKTPADILGNIWRQLLHARAPLSDNAIELYNKHQSDDSRPSIEEISDLLRLQITTRACNFIIIDGLDEYADEDTRLTDLVKTIANFKNTAHIMFTTTEQMISKLLEQSCIRFDLEVTKADVEHFVQGALTRFAQQQLWSWEIGSAIEKITETTGEQWLLTKLCILPFCNIEIETDFHARVDLLPDNLAAAYSAALGQIERSGDTARLFAKTVLRWLLRSSRPLQLTELLAIIRLLVEKETNHLTCNTPEALTRLCGNMVVVDETRNIVRFVHHTARSFVLSSDFMNDTDPNLVMAEECLEYLLQPQFEDTYRLRRTQVGLLVREHGFLAYAATYWAKHAQEALTKSDHLRESTFMLLRDVEKVSFLLDVANFCETSFGSYSFGLPRSASALWIAASYGFDTVVQRLLDLGCNLDEKDSLRNLTPLEEALHQKHLQVASILLQAGASATGMALHLALATGDTPVIRQLLDRRAPVNFRVGRWNIIERALMNNLIEVAKVLFEYDAKFQDPVQFINIWDIMGFGGYFESLDLCYNIFPAEERTEGVFRAVGSALRYGKLKNFEKIMVKYLSPHSVYSDGTSLLALAIDAEQPKVVEKLLAAGAQAKVSDLSTLIFGGIEDDDTRALFLTIISMIDDLNPQGDDLPTPLHTAADKGDTWAATLLIERGASINAKDRFSMTPLHKASKKGHLDVVRLLLTKGCDPTLEQEVEETALSLATEGKHQHVMSALITWIHGGQGSYKDFAKTAMEVAAQKHFHEELKMLLEAEADAAQRREHSSGLLKHCINAGKYEFQDKPLLMTGSLAETLDLLSVQGADFNYRDDNSTALHRAVKRECQQVVEFLLSKSADPNLINGQGRSVLHEAVRAKQSGMVKTILKYKANPNIVDRDGITALHDAVMAGDSEIVIMLLDKNASPAIRDQWGESVMSKVRTNLSLEATDRLDEAMKNYKQGGTEWLRVVVSMKSNKAIERLRNCRDLETTNNLGETLLYRSVDKGRLAIVEYLLIRGAKVDSVNWALQTPCMRAAEKGHVDVVKLLLEWASSIDLQDYFGMTALHRACIAGHKAVVKLVLAHKADASIATREGYTATHLAAKGGHLSILKLLFETGAVSERKAQDSMTCLHLAAANGHEQIVTMLLQQGHSPNAQDWSGYTPLHLAARHGHTQVVKVLLENGADLNGGKDSPVCGLYAAINHDRTESDLNAISVVKLLIEHGAEVDKTGEKYFYDRSPLESAASTGQLRIAQMLIEAGAGRRQTGSYINQGLVARAAEKGNIAMVRLLLDAGFDVNEGDKNNHSAISRAAVAGQMDMLRLLIARGADINAKGFMMSRRPVYEAAEAGHAEVVRLFLNAGCDLDAHMVFPGNTVRDGLLEVEHMEIQRVLSEFGITPSHE